MSATNQRAAPCTECGGDVGPGDGLLWWQPDPDDGGDVVGRAPAGWRVTHLRPEDCAVARVQRATETAATWKVAAPARAEADARRASYDALLDGMAAEVARIVTEKGLVAVPEGLVIAVLSTHKILYNRSVYPPGGGASTEQVALIAEVDDGHVAHLGLVDHRHVWASPTLIAAAQRTARVCGGWWRPGTYSLRAYPGPSVAEADLDDAERALVAEYRAAQTAAIRTEALRAIDAAVAASKELSHVLTIPGATHTIVYGENLDAYLAAQAVDYRSRPRVALALGVRVTLPTSCYDARGKLRTAVAKLIWTRPVDVMPDVHAITEVVRAAA